MTLTLPQIRKLLTRRAAGEILTDCEVANLASSARTLRRRLDRLKAIHPELDSFISLSSVLDELAQPPVLTASN